MQKAVSRSNSLQRKKHDISYTLYMEAKFISPSYILSYLILTELLAGRCYSHFINFKCIRFRETMFLAQDRTRNKRQNWNL